MKSVAPRAIAYTAVQVSKLLTPQTVADLVSSCDLLCRAVPLGVSSMRILTMKHSTATLFPSLKIAVHNRRRQKSQNFSFGGIGRLLPAGTFNISNAR